MTYSLIHSGPTLEPTKESVRLIKSTLRTKYDPIDSLLTFFFGGRVLRNEGTLEKGLLRFLNYILGHELDSLERIPLDLVFFFFFFEL